jgi:hypothetical protein
MIAKPPPVDSLGHPKQDGALFCADCWTKIPVDLREKLLRARFRGRMLSKNSQTRDAWSEFRALIRQASLHCKP